MLPEPLHARTQPEPADLTVATVPVDAADRPQPSAAGASAALAALLRSELLRPASPAVEPLVAAIRGRHGDGVSAILLYGSCLRRDRYDDGVLDFYVLVDGYRGVHASRVSAFANAVLPPSIYYLEVATPTGLLRAKYAVLSHRQFLDGASLDYFQSVVWARFCQPAVLVYERDEDAVAIAVRGAVESTLTMVLVAAALCAEDGMPTPMPPEDLWARGLSATYGAELRVEDADSVRALYGAAPRRYDIATRMAVHILTGRGALRYADERLHPDEVVFDPARLRTVRRQWARRRLTGKPLAAARLLRTLFTSPDAWIPYGLSKLERHTGIQLTLSDRQRSWIWISCWPILVRLLLRRALR